MNNKTDLNLEKILNAARDIFSRYGFRKATIEEIAHAVHMGKSSIYYYYKSKEEIFKAVVEKEAELFRQDLIQKIAEGKTAKEKLQAYIIGRMIKFKRLSNFYAAISTDYLSDLPFISEVRKKYDIEESLLIQNILIEGQVKGEFSQIEEPGLAATTIVIAMKGLEYPLIISESKGEEDLSIKIEKLLDILFYGIIKRK